MPGGRSRKPKKPSLVSNVCAMPWDFTRPERGWLVQGVGVGHASVMCVNKKPETLTCGRDSCAHPHAKATGDFASMYDGLAVLQEYSEVSASWYMLASSTAPIGAFRPCVARAMRLPDCEMSVVIWKQGRRNVPRHPPRPLDAPPTSGALVDGAAEETEEEEEEGRRPDDEEDDGFQVEQELLALLEEVGELGEFGLGAAEEVAGDAAPPAPAGASDAVVPASRGDPEEAQIVEPPPPPLAAARPEARLRRGADVVYQVPGGSISYYRSKSAFEAVCEHRDHGRCVLTRTSKSKKTGRDGVPLGGRPVGFLAGWLSHGHECASKQEHWDQSCIANDHRLRSALREQISQTLAGRLLLSLERAPAPGEAPEPEGLDGLL